MSDVFERIKQGMVEAVQFSEGGVSNAVVHEFAPLDIKAIRGRVGMTQVEFAMAFGISLGTLRHWERGDRRPHGPALALLTVIEKEPEAVLRALHVG